MEFPSKAKGTQHTQIAHTVFQRKPREEGTKNKGIGTKDVLAGFKPNGLE